MKLNWRAIPAKFRNLRVEFAVLIFLLLTGCASLKQCAYEGYNRDDWQQPQKVIESLQIRPGAVVADLGSGSGYFTFDLARAVGPTGKVYAVDIDRDMTDLVTKRAKERGASNIAVMLAKPDDPLLPTRGVDLILTVDAYHHIENRVSYFANLQKYLRPDGRIAIVEFDRRASFAGLWGHYTPAEFIKRGIGPAGLRLEPGVRFSRWPVFPVFSPPAA